MRMMMIMKNFKPRREAREKMNRVMSILVLPSSNKWLSCALFPGIPSLPSASSSSSSPYKNSVVHAMICRRWRYEATKSVTFVHFGVGIFFDFFLDTLSKYSYSGGNENSTLTACYDHDVTYMQRSRERIIC